MCQPPTIHTYCYSINKLAEDSSWAVTHVRTHTCTNGQTTLKHNASADNRHKTDPSQTQQVNSDHTDNDTQDVSTNDHRVTHHTHDKCEPQSLTPHDGHDDDPDPHNGCDRNPSTQHIHNDSGCRAVTNMQSATFSRM